MNILIVDDNEQNRYMLRALLQGYGYSVTEAAHGAEALTRARQSPAGLVISDLLMPVMDGYTLLRHWKSDERLKAIPFVVYTATYTEPKDEQLALDLGADGFIIKPAEPEPFMARVRDVLARSQGGAAERSRAALQTALEEQRKVEAALRDSELRYRRLHESMIDAFVQVDMEGRILEVNPSFLSMLGYSEEELLRRTYADITPEVWHAFETQIVTGQVIPSGHSEVYEKEFRRKDGTVFPAELRTFLIRDDSGRPISMWAIVRDLTERKRAQTALAARERRFRALIEKSAEGLCLLSADGTILYQSPSVLRIQGFAPEERAGRSGFELLHPEDREAVAAVFEQIRHTPGATAEITARLRHKGGTWGWQEATVTNQLADSAIAGFVINYRDITERRRVEDQVRKLAQAVEQSPVSIVITDRDGRIEFANPRFTEMTGYGLEEVLGETLALLKSGEDSAELYAEFLRAIADGVEWHGELHNRRKDGGRFWDTTSISPIRSISGEITHFVAIKEDITEKKGLEDKLLRAQRLEAIGTLASGIAHDLNNILAPLTMTTPLLRESLQDEESREMLDTVDNCAERGARVVRQLLTFAGGRPGTRVSLPVQHLVREMEKLIRETFPREVSLVVLCPRDLWALSGDPTQIHQVLLNLCINARDAMPTGGTLTIEARNVSVDEVFASMTPQARPGLHVCLSVRDTGVGIAPENMERIFDPFFTTKEVGKGTGLGLATVQRILRGHEGFLRVSSHLGKGTAFDLFFPASPNAEARDTEAAQHGVPPRARGELILVVDDEAAVRQSLRRMLEAHGYRVLTASHGAEGLKVFSSQAAHVRAVLTDVMMPVMSGANLIRALRVARERLPILVMTGLPESGSVDGLERLGVAAKLAKPFVREELLRELSKAILSHPACAPARDASEPPN